MIIIFLFSALALDFAYVTPSSEDARWRSNYVEFTFDETIQSAVVRFYLMSTNNTATATEINGQDGYFPTKLRASTNRAPTARFAVRVATVASKRHFRASLLNESNTLQVLATTDSIATVHFDYAFKTCTFDMDATPVVGAPGVVQTHTYAVASCAADVAARAQFLVVPRYSSQSAYGGVTDYFRRQGMRNGSGSIYHYHNKGGTLVYHSVYGVYAGYYPSTDRRAEWNGLGATLSPGPHHVQVVVPFANGSRPAGGNDGDALPAWAKARLVLAALPGDMRLKVVDYNDVWWPGVRVYLRLGGNNPRAIDVLAPAGMSFQFDSTNYLNNVLPPFAVPCTHVASMPPDAACVRFQKTDAALNADWSYGNEVLPLIVTATSAAVFGSARPVYVRLLPALSDEATSSDAWWHKFSIDFIDVPEPLRVTPKRLIIAEPWSKPYAMVNGSYPLVTTTTSAGASASLTPIELLRRLGQTCWPVPVAHYDSPDTSPLHYPTKEFRAAHFDGIALCPMMAWGYRGLYDGNGIEKMLTLSPSTPDDELIDYLTSVGVPPEKIDDELLRCKNALSFHFTRAIFDVAYDGVWLQRDIAAAVLVCNRTKAEWFRIDSEFFEYGVPPPYDNWLLKIGNNANAQLRKLPGESNLALCKRMLV